MTSSSRRPEHTGPPEIFYDENEARKYTHNSRIIEIQRRMSARAIELLALPANQPRLLLDLGCGSALSGHVMARHGHVWIGCDISRPMLHVAVQRNHDDDSDDDEDDDSDDDEERQRGCGDVFLSDLGDGVPLRAGCCDGAISVSAVQWLCNADRGHHQPRRRLLRLFSSLYSCLSRGSRAVFQFYPENSAQVEMITTQAMRAGFSGGLVVDFPNSSKARKMFLVLMTGGQQPLPAALSDASASCDQDASTCSMYGRRERMRRARGPKMSRSWILEKKERRRRQGRHVVNDSKYTGRKRRCAF